MQRDNWDDLRFVLAVADAGSVSAAARRLGVNHATVLRRIAAFEMASGLVIFDKSGQGYAVPADRQRIIAAAREVDHAVAAVARMLEGARAPLSGDVRVTATDSFCLHVLPPILADLRDRAPDLRIEVIGSNAHVDLGRVEADISVRLTQVLPEDLDGVPAGRLGFGLFRRRGAETARWLGLSGPLALAPPGRWMAENVEVGMIAGSADSFLVLREMAAEGMGQVILPTFLGAEDARLEAVPAVFPGLSVGIWVASHADLAVVPRIAQARALLAEALRGEAVRLLG